MSLISDVLDYFVPNSLLAEIFSKLLLLDDVCRFDSALCNKQKRPSFIECIGSQFCVWLGDKDRDFTSDGISWLKIRSIKINNLICSRITDELAVKIGDVGSCLHWLSFKSHSQFTKSQNDLLTDQALVKLLVGCPNLHALDVSECKYITDGNVVQIALCSRLNKLNLSGCIRVSDISVIKLADNCSQLRKLSLYRCPLIKDMSIVRLVEKCHNLYSLDLRWCNVTNVSVIKIGEGCPYLECLYYIYRDLIAFLI